MVSKLQFLNFLKSVFYFQESVQNVNWHSDFYLYTTEVLGFFHPLKRMNILLIDQNLTHTRRPTATDFLTSNKHKRKITRCLFPPNKHLWDNIYNFLKIQLKCWIFRYDREIQKISQAGHREKSLLA